MIEIPSSYSLTKENVEAVVNGDPNKRAVVAGDFAIDRIYNGHWEGISVDAPIPVFFVDDEDNISGCAGNSLAQLKTLIFKSNAVDPVIDKQVHARFVSSGQNIFRYSLTPKPKFKYDGLELTKTNLRDENCAGVLFSEYNDFGTSWLNVDIINSVCDNLRPDQIAILSARTKWEWGDLHERLIITTNSWNFDPGYGPAVITDEDGEVVVTLENGDTLQDVNVKTCKIIEPFSPVDTVGAGDSFSAALFAAMSVLDDLVLATEFACLAAATFILDSENGVMGKINTDKMLEAIS